MDLNTQSEQSPKSGLPVCEMPMDVAFSLIGNDIVNINNRLDKIDKELKSLRGMIFLAMKKKKQNAV